MKTGWIAVGLIALLFTQCKNDKATTDTSQATAEEAPPYLKIEKPGMRLSEEGTYVECLIDDQLWEAASTNGRYIEEQETGQVILHISSSTMETVAENQRVRLLELLLHEFDPEKKVYTKNAKIYYKVLERENPSVHQYESTKARIEVSRWVGDKYMISGSFSGTLVDGQGNKIEIQAGRFKDVVLDRLKI